MPGLAVLFKNCVIARKQLRREAFSKEVRHRPFVVELIDDDIFIDSLFSTSTVERIKNQLAWSQSFVPVISSQDKPRNSGRPSSLGGSRFFGENIPPRDDRWGLKPLPILGPPTKWPRLLPDNNVRSCKVGIFRQPTRVGTPNSLSHRQEGIKDKKDLLIDLGKVDGRFQRFV